MKILIFTNSSEGAYMFRRELISTLLKKHTVALSVPKGLHFDDFGEMGCKMIDTPFSRHGKNVIGEARLIGRYRRILSDEKPDVVLTFTVKPNIYVLPLCKRMKIACIANVAGLGTQFENGGTIRKTFLKLYVSSLEKASFVFFQNEYVKNLFEKSGLKNKSFVLSQGSGVNVDRFVKQPYPEKTENAVFLFAGRIVKDKGIDEFLRCAEIIKTKYPNTDFEIAGVFEDKEYERIVKGFQKKATVKFLGFLDDMRPAYKRSWALINPSYHEGMSNVCLEAASSARAVIASDIPGCRETVENGKTGFTFEAKSVEALAEAVERFLSLPYEDKVHMGLEGRKKAETEFDRQLVTEKYEEIIENLS